MFFTKRTLLLLVCLLSVCSLHAQVTANFTQDATAGCAPLLVNFTNTSTPTTGLTYQWDLGNGGPILTQTNVSTSYLTPGTYTIKLTVKNASGATSVKTSTVTVYPAPTVAFSVTPTTVCPGAPVIFTDQSDPKSLPATYNWNFGDGNSATTQNATHTYSTSGSYNITLVVTNAQGCISTLVKQSVVTISQPPKVDFTVSNVIFCKAPATVTFTNTATGTPTLTYQWDFGDGGTSTTANPTHTYVTSGNFNVKLVVTDGNGCKDSITKQAAVRVGNVKADFVVPQTVCPGVPILFQNTSTPGGLTSEWDFGDGNGSTDTNPIHTYGAGGTYNVRLVYRDGTCADTVIKQVTIFPAPTAKFTASPDSPCVLPATINFTSDPSLTGVTYAWTFSSDGTTASTANTSKTYTAPTPEIITLVTKDANGCMDSFTLNMDISGFQMTASATPDTGCKPLNVKFRADGTYPVASYSWDFGDGNSGTGQAPTHIYTNVGIYYAVVTLVSKNGCTVSDTLKIKVGEKPIVTYTATPMTLCAHKEVTFRPTTTGDTVFYWDFGDKSTTTSGDTVIRHKYDPGKYFPKLVGYYNGCPSDTFRGPVITVDSPRAVMGPPLFVCDTPKVVKFRDISIGATSVEWFFGDGTSDTARNARHEYLNVGHYKVMLVAYNSRSGCRDTATVEIDLVELKPDFTSDTLVCKGATVNFISTVTGGTPNTYLWYTDDPVQPGLQILFSTSANASYVFTKSGYHTVEFQVTDLHGCNIKKKKINWVHVIQPVDSFVGVPNVGCLPLTVNFTEYSTPIPGITITSRLWIFGDGTTATTSATTISHTYTTAGTYDVKEVVTNSWGCLDTVTRLQYISAQKPVADFYVDNQRPCIGSVATFTSTSTGNPTTLAWRFGDGGTATGNVVTHTYTATGTYNVTLVVTNAIGCKDSITKTGYITVTKPTAAFTPSDTTSVCVPLIVSFTNASLNATSYEWDFGNGNTSVNPTPSNSYNLPGIYTVRLIAIDANGCRDTAYRTIKMYGYAGSLQYSPLSGCKPLTVNFTTNVTNVATVTWDFNDGYTSTTTGSVSHTYTVPGAYVPRLIMSNGAGCQASSVGLDTIKVDGFHMGFTTDPNPICIYDTVRFTDTSKSLFSPAVSRLWQFENGATDTGRNPVRYYGTAGDFNVRLTMVNGNGCRDTMDTKVTVHPLPIIKAAGDTLICVGDAANLIASGGVSYTWAPVGTLSCTNCANPDASPTQETKYIVTGTDANGCINYDSVIVRTKTHTTGVFGDGGTICAGDTISVHASGGHVYTWIPATGLSDATSPNPIAAPSATTNYTVVVKEASCIADTGHIKVVVIQIPQVNAGGNQTIYAGQIAELQATGHYVDEFVWHSDPTLSCDTCTSPKATPAQTTTYTVVGYADFGCKDSANVTVKVICDDKQLFLPNTFTPNGDGMNDVFYPRGTGITKVVSFRVYNRWGELMFERSNIDINDAGNAWDGTYKGAALTADVYVYTVEALCLTGEPLSVKGDISIVR